MNYDSIPNSIISSLKEIALKRPHDIALYDESSKLRKISFSRLYQQVMKTSDFLKVHGYCNGKRAAILLNNSIEFPIIYLGIWSCGGTVVGSSTLLNADELRYQWFDSKPTIIFTSPSHLQTVLQAVRKCPTVKKIVCIRPTEDCEIQLEVVGKSMEEECSSDNKFDEFIDSISLIYYTSGTTGEQKGVIHTHRSLQAGVSILARFLLNAVHPAVGLATEAAHTDCQILSIPLFHYMGFLYINACLLTGLPVVINLTADPNEVLRMINQYEPTFLLTYPTMVRNFVDCPCADMKSVKVIVSSGSPLRKTIAHSFMRLFPTVKHLAQGFGMTEVGFTHFPLLLDSCSVDSVGAAATEYEQKVIGLNYPCECPKGEIGEICLRGPAVTTGYLNKHEETRKIIDEDGWVHTGDVGFVNELGELHLIDRKKDIINIIYNGSSYRILPSIVEQILLSSPRVRDAAVAGCFDEEGHVMIRAFIVRADEQLSDEDVHAIIKNCFPDSIRLTGGVRFVPIIPRSGGGKILRRLLTL